MNNTFSSNDRVGDIVTRFPKSSEIFKDYAIDFCCRGNRKLKDVIEQQKLDELNLLDRLNKEYEKYWTDEKDYKDWNKAAYSELVEHIVKAHHSYLLRELPIIAELTDKIEEVHGRQHEELHRVNSLFRVMKHELEEHMIKEEEIVFPQILEYERTKSQEALNRALQVVIELENEHEAAGDILKELRRITYQFSPPQGGCTTYCLTYKKLEELETDIFQHIHLENNILHQRLLNEQIRA
ncbi:MAG: iron-sulfur cluster repair di-iron protein [Bacillota bacterium]